MKYFTLALMTLNQNKKSKKGVCFRLKLIKTLLEKRLNKFIKEVQHPFFKLLNRITTLLI